MTYGKRLDQAIELAESSRKDVAKAAGITVQAIGQCIRGETDFLRVDGSAKAAAFLKVDHLWLATGEGEPRPQVVWPFLSVTADQYASISKANRDIIEAMAHSHVPRESPAKQEVPKSPRDKRKAVKFVRR